MTTGLSYDGSVAGTASYVTQIAEMAVVPATDANYVAILPAMITYAENRIYRDLDFLVTVNTGTYSVTGGNRQVAIPTADFVTIQQVNLQASGVTSPLLPVTKEYLDVVYPNPTPASTPQYFAMLTQNTILLGPWPDTAYSVQVVGTIRPASMSSSNQTTFISLYLPDLLIMASMVYISAYQRNFSGMAANDPQMPVSYESQYQTLLKGAMVEEARKKFQSTGWTSMSPAPVASPSRG
jgi:hypothetical protein